MTRIYFTIELPGLGDSIVVTESPGKIAVKMRQAARNDDPTIELSCIHGEGGAVAMAIPTRIIGPAIEIRR